MGAVADRATVAGLIRSASCVVAHSRLESFGFVPLEALACGVPVAASEIPAHREVCGDAVHYYDPASSIDLQAAVKEALATGPAAVQAPGLARTWDENGADLVEIFRRTAAV